MGVKERRERQREEVRQTIMDAARDLFVNEGYEAVSMRRIADAIEYSPTAIYVHFHDKADLMRAICEADSASMSEGFQHVRQIPDPLDRIRQLGWGYIRFAMDHPNHFRLMFMDRSAMAVTAVNSNEADLASRNDPNRNGYAMLVWCVEQAIAAGRLRPDFTDAHLVAQLLWSAVHGVAALEATRPRQDVWCPWRGTEQVAQLMIDSVLRSIAVDPAGEGRS